MSTTSYPHRWLVLSPGMVDDPGVFPLLPGQTFFQLKTPVWSTKVDISVSGRERRRALWSYPLWKFTVGYELLRDTVNHGELDKLLAFFNNHMAGFQSWKFFDVTDNRVINQYLGVGDGVTSAFQLTRSIASGSLSFTEPIREAVGIPQVTVNGVATTAFSYSAGVITFTAPPTSGAIIRWSGQFYFVCRFLDDELTPAQMVKDMWSTDGISFQTEKTP